MPSLLRRDTIHLFEASLNCLGLALIGLAVPKSLPIRSSGSKLAAELGLIGTAAELAVSACSVQFAGPSIIVRSDGGFKTATQMIDEFSKTLRSPTPQLHFLTQGVAKPSQHRAVLESFCRKFRLLARLRASALHAGKAPSRDVCLSLANDVCNFLDTLGASERIRPYLEQIPRPPQPMIQASVLVEDLLRQIRNAKSISEQALGISNIYLVLPDIPEQPPEWLNAFDRITVAPQKSDVAFLLETLEQAIPVSLRRTVSGSKALSVVVKPGDPAAIPIEPHYLRREFTKTPDRFHADIGNANGRLNEGVFDPPPIDAVRELISVGIEESGVLEPNQRLSAHETWPFVASSLATHGTPGPIWFLVRHCNDLGQLRALLDRAGNVAPRHFQRNLEDIAPGINAIVAETRVPRKGLFDNLLSYHQRVIGRRDKLASKIEATEGTDKRLTSSLEGRLYNLVSEDESIMPVISALLDPKSTHPKVCIEYWARVLGEIALLQEDLPALLAVLRYQEGTSAKTPARKAFQLIDFLRFGPDVEQ